MEVGSGTRDEPVLLERGPQLATLHAAWDAVRSGRGGVLVLLAGEAGSGKTTVLRRFRAECRPPDIVLWGACDPLFTPRPLGPFADFSARMGELGPLLAGGARPHQVAEAIAEHARAAARPDTVAVLEDLHWADEATLDVLSLLARRIGSIPLLLVGTYRDDELHRHHPLRTLIGELRGVRRLCTEPLSPDAVSRLARPHGLDGAELYRVTGGNPFFLTEVIEAGGATIPPTVRDAVLARTARLTGSAADVVDAVSVAVPHAELWLLDALVPDAADGIDECLAAGILTAGADGVGFRHELARRAVEESLPPHRRRDLHRRALDALAARPADLARLAHHAEAAGDTAAVLRYAPAAAEQASATGAHREAAEEYARALRSAAGLPAGDRAALLEAGSYEYYLTDRMDDAIALLEQAVELRRPLLRILGLTVLGLVRARRGDPERWPPLDEAALEAKGQREPQYRVPVATARAEAAWLDGRGGAAVHEESGELLAVAGDRDAGWIVGELAWLRRLAGLPATAEGTAGPYRLQLAGDLRAAAARWGELGCRYDAALALAASDDEEDLREALAGFQRLGARSAAAVVSRRLREGGARGVGVPFSQRNDCSRTVPGLLAPA